MGRPLLDSLLERCTFPDPGAAVTCAVSGGPDSTALLALAVRAGCRATAVHVDHGLRAGTKHEADVVAGTAATLGATFRSEKVEIEPGPNLEARARAARFGVLPADVMTGHTADDQAETVLLNLLRGTGPEGLGGMRPGRRHPILALRRAETVAVCRELGLTTIDDPTNAELGFRRNRIRHEVLPLLADVADRDVVPLLERTADVTREAVDHLMSVAEGLDPTDVAVLRAAPVPLARLAIRNWLRSCSPDAYAPDATSVDRVLTVVRGEAVATQIAGGWRVERSSGRLRVVQC